MDEGKSPGRGVTDSLGRKLKVQRRHSLASHCGRAGAQLTWRHFSSADGSKEWTTTAGQVRWVTTPSMFSARGVSRAGTKLLWAAAICTTLRNIRTNTKNFPRILIGGNTPTDVTSYFGCCLRMMYESSLCRGLRWG